VENFLECDTLKAREYFEQASEAAQDMHSASLRLSMMRESETLQAVRYDKETSGNAASDSMAKVDSRIDFEAVFDKRIADDQNVIDDAFLLLYGTDGKGGLAHKLGNRYADVLCAHYLQLETYVDIGYQLGCGDRYLRMLADEALNYIDRVGFAKIRDNND
jgi:hypothetical protein